MENTSPTETENHIKKNLVEAILKTIRFYDLFDFPLTAEEIKVGLYKYHQPLHIKELKATLDHMVEEGQLVFLKEYYVFPGREPLIETRKTRKFIAEKFWNRVKLYGQYMRAVPFVKMIAVCNNLAYDNPTEQSDIDLFIVIESGRMWTARLLITLILQFYGVRRYKDKIAGRFCLSFFVTDKALDISQFELQPEDPYLAYWTRHLSPVYGEDTFDLFKERNQAWLKGYGMEFNEMQKRNMYFYRERKTKRLAEWLLNGFLGNLFEGFLKFTLKKKTLGAAKKLGGESCVIVSDEVLKFHNHDRRKEYYQAWKNELS